MFQTPPQRETARALFAHRKLAIPVYQRGYAWEDEQIEDFILDLSNLWRSQRRPEDHFLGTMLCYSRTDGDWGAVLEIIDGQQRLTTISLLLVAIREGAKRILTSELLPAEVHAVALRVAQKAAEGVQSKSNADEIEPRLSLNEHDDFEWRRLVTEGTVATREMRRNLPRSSNLINDAYEEILQRLVLRDLDLSDAEAAQRSVKQLDERLKRALDSLLVVLLTAENEKDVYDLFMIINDRGKPLSNVDLLRTSTLQRLKNRPRDFRRAKTSFGMLVNAEETSANKALVHYVNSHFGSRIPKSRVLPETRSILFGTEERPATPDEMLDRLDLVDKGTSYLLRLYDATVDWYGEAYPYPADAAGADRHYRLIGILKSESSKPLLVAAREKLNQQQFFSLLGVLERIVIRVLMTNGVHKSQLADFFIEQASRLRNPETEWTSESFWRDALAEDLGEGRVTIALASSCTDQKFKEGVQELTYKRQRAYIAFVLHGIESFDERTGSPAVEVTFNFKQLHLDHIVPRSDESNPVVIDQLHDAIGNLVLLSGQRNQSLGGLPYGPEKARAYVQSRIQMTKEIGANSQIWTSSDVRERSKELAAQACKVWSLSARLW